MQLTPDEQNVKELAERADAALYELQQVMPLSSGVQHHRRLIQSIVQAFFNDRKGNWWKRLASIKTDVGINWAPDNINGG